MHLVIRWREDRAAGVSPLRGQRASAALMLAATAVSAVAWPVLVGVASGLPRAFFDVQAAWGQQPDRGPFVLWLTWAWDERGIAGVIVMVGLVATYVALTTDAREVVKAHVDTLLGQLTRIITDGVVRGELETRDSAAAARAVFDATARFHNPVNAAAWSDPDIGVSYENVRALVLAGLTP